MTQRVGTNRIADNAITLNKIASGVLDTATDFYARAHTNAAFDAANTNTNTVSAAFGKANASFDKANAGFDKANTAITTSGGTITGTLNISSNVFIGNTVNPVDIIFTQDGEIRPQSGKTIYYTGTWKGSNNSANVLSGIPMVVTVERSGVGSLNGMSFGNGSTGDGMRMPYAGKIIAATLGCTSLNGSFAAELEVNGSLQASYNLIATTASASNAGDTEYFSTPYSFSASDLINFRQTLVPTGQTTAVVSFWIVFD